MPVVDKTRPVVERIAVVLFERLSLLKHGYTPTSPIVEVIRPTRFGGFTPKHLQIVLTQADPERADEIDRPGNPPAVGMMVRFSIHCHLMPSEKDTIPVEEYINTINADVIEVVTKNDGTWYRFRADSTDLAINAEWGAPEYTQADGGIDGFTQPLFVTYRTSEHSPYQLRA